MPMVSGKAVIPTKRQKELVRVREIMITKKKSRSLSNLKHSPQFDAVAVTVKKINSSNSDVEIKTYNFKNSRWFNPIVIESPLKTSCVSENSRDDNKMASQPLLSRDALDNDMKRKLELCRVAMARRGKQTQKEREERQALFARKAEREIQIKALRNMRPTVDFVDNSGVMDELMRLSGGIGPCPRNSTAWKAVMNEMVRHSYRAGVSSDYDSF